MSSGCVVLMYHVVGPARAASEQRFCCPINEFRTQMAVLVAERWNVLSLAELLRRVARAEEFPARSVAITFDDGTACTHETALPILKEFGFPATVFAVSQLVGRRNEWMIREGQPARAMLSATQLRELDAEGIEIGSHTAHHVRMTRLPPAEAAEEARISKARLEELLGKEVLHFAYPYGDRNEEVQAIVREAGYRSACTTRWGKNSLATDLFALRRTEIMGTDALWQFRWKLRTATHDMPPWSLARARLRGLQNSLCWR